VSQKSSVDSAFRSLTFVRQHYLDSTTLERAMILGNGEWVTPADLPRGIEPDTVLMASLSDNLKDAMQAYEKSHIERVLKRMDGDKKGAAEALGMSLSSLYRKLEDLTIGAE
jgi:DNA-binding NtrC family response regulator